jgi:hypothetical protein
MTVKTTDFTLDYLYKDFLPGEFPVSHGVNEVGYCALPPKRDSPSRLQNHRKPRESNLI